MSSLLERLPFLTNISSPYTLLFSVAGVLLCHGVVSVYRTKSGLGFLPGRTLLISPATVIGNFVLPRIRGISTGRNFLFVNKYSEFLRFGASAYRLTTIYPTIESLLVLADADAIKEVTSSRARFPKPTELYAVLAFFGRNIVVSEGDEWKKYRKISAPAFSEKNNKLVWDETVSIVEGLFADVWGDKKEIVVDHVVDITLPLALFVIGAAGFGQHMSWKDTEVCPEGHKLSFKQALHHVATDVFIKLAVPGWAMGLTDRTRQTRLAFDELETYISEMIRERTADGAVDKNDLFSNLLASNASDSEKNAMTEQELAGNVFIFLIAGHETTAHTLAFAFAYLALYPEEQEKVYQQIKTVLPNGGSPSYEDRTKLDRCIAAYYETLRLVPPVTNVPKFSAEDTTLTITNAQGEKVVIPVPKGTQIALDTAGLHYNPLYWKDPHAFKPDRFLSDYNRDAFIPFSAGSRSCIGRRFFEVEGISALTLILSKYKISIKEEPQFSHETFEQRKERVLNARAGITVTPIRVPLVFTRRD